MSCRLVSGDIVVTSVPPAQISVTRPRSYGNCVLVTVTLLLLLLLMMMMLFIIIVVIVSCSFPDVVMQQLLKTDLFIRLSGWGGATSVMVVADSCTSVCRNKESRTSCDGRTKVAVTREVDEKVDRRVKHLQHVADVNQVKPHLHNTTPTTAGRPYRHHTHLY